jgi:hypothetical protein
MDFDRAQQILEALQTRCPHTDKPEVDAWTRAITRAREALVRQQIAEDKAALATANPGLSAGNCGAFHIVKRNPDSTTKDVIDRTINCTR